jgi:transcriptional regulator with XRE-family HTH domain
MWLRLPTVATRDKSLFTREYKIFCRLLRESRDADSISQIELASQLKETPSEISKFERGERRLDIVQLHRWCKSLGIGLTDFVREFEVQARRPSK